MVILCLTYWVNAKRFSTVAALFSISTIGVGGENTSVESQHPRPDSQLCHRLNWVTFLQNLSGFQFLICKMGNMELREDYIDDMWEDPSTRCPVNVSVFLVGVERITKSRCGRETDRYNKWLYFLDYHSRICMSYPNVPVTAHCRAVGTRTNSTGHQGGIFQVLSWKLGFHRVYMSVIKGKKNLEIK